MFETLFSIGGFQLKTLSLFQALSFLVVAIIVWKRSKEENYPETTVFDGYLLSFLFGLIVGRVGHIIFSWSRFQLDILKWFNFVQYPGVQLLFGLVGAGVYLYFFAKKQKWDAFEILDWWAQAITLGLVWINLSFFMAGTRFGNETSLPWGIVFPGVFEKRHPVQLYFVIFHLVVYKLLNWLEYHYRTFEWYRSGKKTAQTGFVFSCMVLCYSVFSLLMSLFQPPIFMLGTIVLDHFLYLLLLIFSLIIILNRANRSFFSFSQKKFFVVKK